LAIAEMVPPEVAIKILLLVPSVIFFFYSGVYLMLAELNSQSNLRKFYRLASLVLAGGGGVLISIYLILQLPIK
jgi:cellobiose-specific phosphotransferase system component IIC